MVEVKWERPTYKLVAWDGPNYRCHGHIAPCIKLAELALPLPGRPGRLLYCLDCWKSMADHLIRQGYKFDVTEEASRVFDTRKQRPIRLHLTNVRAPDRVRADDQLANRCVPRRHARPAASAQQGVDCTDA